MKKVLIVLVAVAMASAQVTVSAQALMTKLNWTGTGTGSFDSPLGFGANIEYKTGEMGEITHYGHIGFSLGSVDNKLNSVKITNKFTWIEVGGSAHYPFNNDVYGLGKLLYSYQNQEQTNDANSSSIKVTEGTLSIIIGAGYKMDALNFEAGYAISGIAGLRFTAGYTF